MISEVFEQQVSSAPNPIKERSKAVHDAILQTAENTGETPENVALDYLDQHREDLENYVKKSGEVPAGHIHNLSKQAAIIRARQVQQVAEAQGISTAQAEELIEQAEAEQEAMNSSEADSFIGHHVGALHHALAHHYGKRYKAGAENATGPNKKKGNTGANILGVVGDLVQFGLGEVSKIKSGEFLPGAMGQDEGQDAAENAKIGAKEVAQKVVDAVTAQKKKEEIQKMLPLIIIGVVALIVVVFFIARKTK